MGRTLDPGKRSYPEQDLAKAVARYLDYCAPPGLYWTAINPVPGKTKIAAALSKAMGMKAGAPDYLFIYRGRAILIELKAGKGSTSDAQKAAHQQIVNAGGIVTTAKSIDEVRDFLSMCGVPLMDRLVKASREVC